MMATPSGIVFSKRTGLGKSTLAYHFINYVLSDDEDYRYNIKNFEINSQSSTFKTILNKSNTNLIVIDVNFDKKTINSFVIFFQLSIENQMCGS